MRGVSLLALLLLIGGCATSGDENVDVWQAGESYFVTVGVSKLVMVLPKDDLAPDSRRVGSPNESSRYFKFAAPDDSLIVSGWFEPDRLFEGVDENWKQRTANARKMGLPGQRDVQFSKLGNWQLITYEAEIPSLTSTHMLAHWVQAGTWIELHLSTSGDPAADNRTRLAAYLQRVSVTEK